MFTRIFRSFESVIQVRAKDRTEAWVAAYTVFAGKPLLPTTEPVRTIAPRSGIETPRSLNAEDRALHIAVEQLVKLRITHLAEWNLFRAPAFANDVEPSLLLIDLVEEPVEIGHLGYIALHAGDVFANFLDCFVNLHLATASDIYMRSFGDEQLCCCQADSAGTICDQR
jgi:hypothetical protein